MRRAAIVLVCIGLLGAGVMPNGSRASTGAEENEHLAETDAASLLPLLVLPSGTALSADEPAGDGGHLADPSERPATPNLVDEHAWWIVPLRRAETIAFVRAHPPVASKSTGGGVAGTGRVVSSGDPGVGNVEYEWEVFGFPPVEGALAQRSLIVTAVQLPDGSSGVRADAQVVWLTPRPVAEVIPSGAHLLRVSVLSQIARNRSGQRPFAVTSARRIATVTRLLNTLPVTQPGARSCPVDFGNRVRLAFYARRGAAPLSIVTINPEGCGSVGVVIKGKSEQELEGGSNLIEKIDGMLGVTIRTRPRR
jgi:hypothetical protein